MLVAEPLDIDRLVLFEDAPEERSSRDAAKGDSAQAEIMAEWTWGPHVPGVVSVGAAIRAGQAGNSCVVCKTVERIKQRIDDRLAERLCCLIDLSLVSVAGGGGEFRTLIRQDRIGPIDRPLRKIVSAVDVLEGDADAGSRACACGFDGVRHPCGPARGRSGDQERREDRGLGTGFPAHSGAFGQPAAAERKTARLDRRLASRSMSLPAWHEEAISKAQDRSDFDCGDADMIVFLARYARQSHEQNATKTYCAIETARPGRILGFYSIAPSAVEHAAVPALMTKGLARHDVPGFLLARIAIGRSIAGRGWAVSCWLPPPGGVCGWWRRAAASF